MKIFNVNAEINGTITFEVKAKNMKEAQKQVDDLLGNLSVKEAIGKYQDSMTLNTKIKEQKQLER